MNKALTINFLKEVEGKKTNSQGEHIVYYCSAGKKTIGYGETLESRVSLNKISEDMAISFLQERIESIEKYIISIVGLQVWEKMNDNQQTALISLVYNLGSLSKTPKLVNNLKRLDFENAVNEFADCNKITINGIKQISDGLNNRRIKEMELWKTKS